MNFILDEAQDEFYTLKFSDEENIEDNTGDFINDDEMLEEGVSCYQEKDNNHYKFNNQTRDPRQATFENDEIFFGKDSHPKLFDPEDRESVDFDKFQGFEIYAQKFKDDLLEFHNIENHLFYSVIFGLMFCKAKNCKNINLLDAQKVLGDYLYFDLMEIEDETMLDKTIFGYFDKCHKINRVISKHRFSLKFLERRNMYRFLIKKIEKTRLQESYQLVSQQNLMGMRQ